MSAAAVEPPPLQEAECIQWAPFAGTCAGPVEYRMPLSGTGVAYPRCEQHWEERLDLEDRLRRKYPPHPPADWSPDDAGESWDEDL